MQHSRLNLYAFSVLLAGSAGMILLTTPAQSQLGTGKGNVILQGVTPGSSQSGHANISGTMRAGQFTGSGAGLHSIPGEAISSGVISGEFLPDAVAMEDELNVFTLTNTFNGTTNFNGTARFNGFASVGRSGGPINGSELFGIGESGTGYQGMYIKMSASGQPYYGYATGANAAWHYLDGPTQTWKLVVGNQTNLRVSANGVGINTNPSTFSGTVLSIAGVTEIDGNNSGVLGAIDIVQVGTGFGIQSVAYADNSAGVLARTGHSTGYGLYADATSGPTGTGVFGFGWGTQSTGVKGNGGSFGGYFDSTSGNGVKGVSGGWYGVEGSSTNSHGVIGFSTNNAAVVGRTFATSQNSVHGYANTLNSNGGFFWADIASGTGSGVVGQTGSASGYGVASYGRFMATGTKSFRIDHPLDPENKYLSHYCAEGPEPLNIYSGETHTEANGYVTIRLPEYFEEINKNPRIQLTVDDDSEDFVLAKVVGGVNGNSFRIRTSKPGVKVYWEVKAVRNDLFVRQYGAPVVTEKPAAERGRYQHPELYGAPASQGIHVVDPTLAAAKAPSVPAAPERLPISQRTQSRKQ